MDLTESFVPVAKMATVRTLISVVVSRNWPVHQMDIHNSFLYGDFKEEVYMRPYIVFERHPIFGSLN